MSTLFRNFWKNVYDGIWICCILWLQHFSVKNNYQRYNFALPHLKRALKSPNDLYFLFPKFCLLRCFTLSTQIYVQSAKWKRCWLIEMNIWKTQQVSSFSFIVLNVAERAVLHFFLIMLNYIKSALRKKQPQLPTQSTLKKNCSNTKNVSF